MPIKFHFLSSQYVSHVQCPSIYSQIQKITKVLTKDAMFFFTKKNTIYSVGVEGTDTSFKNH